MLGDPNFNLLAPQETTETELLVGIPDAENQVYSGAATYAIDAQVWYGGNVWSSLQAGNTGNTPVEGAWWTDLGEVDQGADEYDAGTTYALDDYVVYLAQVWKSAEASNLGNTPTEAATEWTLQGATNRFKAFDGFLQDAAGLSGDLVYSLQFVDLVTDIALLRAIGNTATITMTDATDGVVYDETFDLQDNSAIVDAWEYCFGAFIFIDTITATLPPYAGAEIDVVIDGSETSVGQIIAGSGLALGYVTTGTSVGIESYSIKDRDDFNRSIVVERPYSDTVSFDLAIPTQRVGYVKNRLADREASPTLFYMTDGASFGAVAFGFFRDFDILHSTTQIADCILEIEGLG